MDRWMDGCQMAGKGIQSGEMPASTACITSLSLPIHDADLWMCCLILWHGAVASGCKYSFSGSVLNSGLSAVLWNELLHLCNGTICSNYVNDWKYVWTRFITTTPHILTVRTMWVAIRDFQPIWRLANLSISQHVFVLLLFALIRWWLRWPLVKLRIIGEKTNFPWIGR